MKKLIVATVTLFVCLVLATPMVVRGSTSNDVWKASIEVQQNAKAIVLRNIMIQVLPNDTISVLVNWNWTDAKGEVIRNGSSRFTENQIEELLAKKGLQLSTLRNLFLAIAVEEAQR